MSFTTPRLFDDTPERPHVKRDAQGDYRLAQLKKLGAISAGPLPQIPEFRGEKRIVLNCETNGLRWYGDDKPIGWAYSLPESGRSGYLPIRHEAGQNLPIEQVKQWLGDIRDMDVENTNIKFDLHMSREDGVDLIEETGNRFADASHLAAMLDDNRMRFNLDQLSKDYLSWEDDLGGIPSEINHEGEFRYLDHTRVAPYALRNVEQVRQLTDELRPQISDEDMDECWELERDVIPVVVEMEKNGVYLDMDLLHKWQYQARDKMESLLNEVGMSCGFNIESPDSPKDLERIFNKLSLPINRTEHGNPSFTSGVMRGAKNPIVNKLIEAGELSDLLSKYLDKYAKTVRSDGWLRFQLHQLRSVADPNGDDQKGTVSGRFSAAGDRQGGFNPQQVVAVEKQLERGWCSDYVVRRLFKTNFAADMMQVEYRLFAHYAKMHGVFHERARYIMDKGKIVWVAGPLADFHAATALLLQKINPALNRKLVKNTNFANIYGAGLIKFAYMIGFIDEKAYKELRAMQAARDWSYKDDPRLQKAKQVKNDYDKMFPNVAPMLKMAREAVEQRGWVKDLVGRRARPINNPNSALNRVIQGGAASINKRVLVETYKERKRLGLTMRLTVHDELVASLEGPVGPVKKVLNRQYFKLNSPILWDAKVGDNWAACK